MIISDNSITMDSTPSMHDIIDQDDEVFMHEIDGDDGYLMSWMPDDAERFLLSFFFDIPRSYYQGGPIPTAELLQQRHIDMVLRLELSDCIVPARAIMVEDGYVFPDNTRQEYQLLLDKKLAIKKLREMNYGSGYNIRSSIPKIITMDERIRYRKLCEAASRLFKEWFDARQKECRLLGIPKRYSGGFLLVYLRMCLGVDV